MPTARDNTFHSLVLKSKVGYGVSALAEAVRLIQSGTVATMRNPEDKATYFSFPDNDAIPRFRERGRRIR
jgi:hypothetical protein